MFFSKQMQEEGSRGEKRAERRIHAADQFLIQYKAGRLFKRIGMGRGKDLSVHGLRFVTTRSFKQDEKLEIELTFSSSFPGKKKIKLLAKVIQTHLSTDEEPHPVACQLFHPDETTSEAIRQFMWWIEVKPS